MSVTSAQPEGITMSGGGLYSLATIGAKHVIDAATPMVEDAISALPDSTLANGFTLSDMGCADAGTSLSMVGKAINAVNQRSPGLPISIVYTDQPRNDFNALITNVYGLGPFETYLDDRENIFPLVSGTSFYRQIVPDSSLNIGFFRHRNALVESEGLQYIQPMFRPLAQKATNSPLFDNRHIMIGDRY